MNTISSFFLYGIWTGNFFLFGLNFEEILGYVLGLSDNHLLMQELLIFFSDQTLCSNAMLMVGIRFVFRGGEQRRVNRVLCKNA